MSVLSNGCFNCLPITARRRFGFPPLLGLEVRPEVMREGWRVEGLRASAIFRGWWWQAGAKRRVWARGLQGTGWSGEACGLPGVRCCRKACVLPRCPSFSCRPRALTRRSRAVRPAVEKNTCTPARIACGRRGFCSRRLSFCNGKLITAAPLHGQRKLARRFGQRGGDELIPSNVNQPHLFPTAQAWSAWPDTRFERRSSVPSAASTSPAQEVKTQGLGGLVRGA